MIVHDCTKACTHCLKYEQLDMEMVWLCAKSIFVTGKHKFKITYRITIIISKMCSDATIQNDKLL